MNPCYLFLILFLPLPLMAAVTAELDKTELFQGQKLTLTLETDQQNASRPDLQQLQRDHLILSTRQVTVSSHSTGAVTTTTRWVVQLRPKREGEIRIPALEVAGELSPALNFTVLPATQNPGLGETDRAIFLEVETDRDELYLNSQLILKAKLYHLSTLPTDASLSAPQSQDALVKPLDEQRQYTQEVRGQSYTVTESSYAIFPREPGEVEISPLFSLPPCPAETYLNCRVNHACSQCYPPPIPAARATGFLPTPVHRRQPAATQPVKSGTVPAPDHQHGSGGTACRRPAFHVRVVARLCADPVDQRGA